MVRDGLLTHFQADQLLQGKWKRFTIGKYKVLERIGAGGMGQVFLCEHRMMRRRVAVKVLPAAKASDPASLERFYREGRAAAALDHPNIARAYDIDQDKDVHFIVMEYIDGTNLQDLVRKVGPLDPIRAANYVHWVAVGLQHAHEMGLVHRDIKPGNVIVDRQGVVKILDLGLARFFDDDDGITQRYDESILGTADYLAPEQALDSHTVDARADLYALGSTFYYLLTGRPPFPEGTVAQKILWHQTREPVPVRSLRPDCPVELAEIVAKLMAKHPGRRIQSPAALMAVLAGWVQTTITPPADRELPHLSLAARGNRPSQPPSDDVGPSRRPGSTPPPAVPGSAPAPLAGVTTPNATEVTIPQYPLDKPHRELRSETAGAPGRVGEQHPTPDGDPHGNQVTPLLGRPDRRIRSQILWTGLAIGWLTTAGFVAFLTHFVFGDASSTVSTSPNQTEEPRRLVVAKSAVGPGTFKTLSAALRAARAADTIILTENLDEPPVRLNGRELKGLLIEPAVQRQTVIWTPNVTVSSSAVLTIEDADGIRVSGLSIECDNRTVAGVVVAGRCPGLVLNNVTVKNPQQVGFRFRNATAETARPATLSDFAVIARPGDDTLEAAVLLTGRTQSVHLVGGRLIGPAAVGFCMTGITDTSFRADGVVTDVVIRNNRVFAADTGVRVTDKVSGDAFGLTVENNTFHTGKTGIACEIALNRPNRQLTVEKNYFGKFDEVLSMVGDAGGLMATDNARDKSTKDGKLKPKPTTVAEESLVSDPSDPHFLRTSLVSKLARYGAK